MMSFTSPFVLIIMWLILYYVTGSSLSGIVTTISVLCLSILDIKLSVFAVLKKLQFHLRLSLPLLRRKWILMQQYL